MKKVLLSVQKNNEKLLILLVKAEKSENDNAYTITSTHILKEVDFKAVMEGKSESVSIEIEEIQKLTK